MQKQVQRLPQSFEAPFVSLSRLTHPIMWALLLVAALLVTVAIDEDYVWRLLLGCLLLLGFEPVLKLLFRRKRPKSALSSQIQKRTYSFPSGHAYATGIIAVAASVIGTQFVSGVLGWTLVAIVLIGAFAVGVSRVYLGLHYASDVVGGWVIGVAVALGIVGFLSVV